MTLKTIKKLANDADALSSVLNTASDRRTATNTAIALDTLLTSNSAFRILIRRLDRQIAKGVIRAEDIPDFELIKSMLVK